MSDIRMYCTAFCPCCVMAENLLRSRGVGIRKVFIDSVPDGFQALFALTGRRTVPQTYSGDTHVGGFADLSALDSRGGPEPLLASI